MIFEKFVCWNRESLENLMQTEATRPDNELFLASHTPLNNLKVEINTEINSEESLATHILTKTNEHTFIIVKGVNGSGKSHLIKWLHTRLTRIKNTKVIFIARHNASLRGVLEQLATSLDEPKLIEGLERVSRTNILGRQKEFLDKLATFTDPNLLNADFPNSQFADEIGLCELLTDQGVRNIMQTSPGPVWRICEHVMEGRTEIKEDQNKFTLEDINLICRKPVNNFTPQTQSSLRMIRNNPDNQKILVDILNDRLPDAIRDLFKIDKSSLPLGFKKIRESLHQNNTRLLLLIEDISCFTGVDDQLIEALITDSGDMAPICTVLGITDQYYNSSILPKGNIKDRITHLISLDGNDENTNILSSDKDRDKFVANYLNAIRADREELRDWEKDLDSEHPSVPPNRCTDCHHKNTCHESFGVVDGIGLYPFNSKSINNFVSALYDTDKGRPAPTPRHLVKFLRFVMPTQMDLNNGTFPSELPPAYINSERLLNQRDSVVQSATQNFPNHTKEAEVIMRIWGDNLSTNLSGLSKNVFVALGLGSPGIHSEDVTPPVDPETRPVPPETRPVPIDIGIKIIQDRMRNAVLWGKDKNTQLQNITTNKNSLHLLLLSTAPWSLSQIPAWWIKKLFDPTKITFEGERAPEGAFTLPRNPVIGKAIEAAASFELNDPDIKEFMIKRDHLDIFIREYGPKLVSRMDERLPKNLDKTTWNVATAACQLLYTYHILNCDISTDISQPNLVQILLFASPSTLDRFYTTDLNRIFTALKEKCSDIRKIAIEWLSCSQNTVDSVIDVSSILPGLNQFCKNLEFNNNPISWGINLPNEFKIEVLKSLFTEIPNTLPNAITTAVEEANQWLKSLNKLGDKEDLKLLLSTGNKLAQKHEDVFGFHNSPSRNRFLNHAQDINTRNLCQHTDAVLISKCKNSLEEVNKSTQIAHQLTALAQLDDAHIKIATTLIDHVVQLIGIQNSDIDAIAETDKFKVEEVAVAKEASLLKKQLLMKLEPQPPTGDYV